MRLHAHRYVITSTYIAVGCLVHWIGRLRMKRQTRLEFTHEILILRLTQVLKILFNLIHVTKCY